MRFSLSEDTENDVGWGFPRAHTPLGEVTALDPQIRRLVSRVLIRGKTKTEGKGNEQLGEGRLDQGREKGQRARDGIGDSENPRLISREIISEVF